MTCYVLTRTSKRPKAFARLRNSLRKQTYPHIVHVVHSDEPTDTYVRGDIVLHSPRLRATPNSTFPWEVYFATMLAHIKSHCGEGWVTFMDDDDVYVNHTAVERMMQYASHPDRMPVWKTIRENNRISPERFGAPLDAPEGRICWESSMHHTNHIGRVEIDGNCGSDGRYWARMSEFLRVVWVDEVFARPQAGKGNGKRKDVP